MAELQALNRVAGQVQVVSGMLDEVRDLEKSRIINQEDTKDNKELVENLFLGDTPDIIVKKPITVLEDNTSIIDSIQMDTSKNYG